MRVFLDTNVLVSAYTSRLGFCAELIDELKPAAGEPLIVKRTHDCFYQTEMDDLRARVGIRPGEGHVIVIGISTRNCVQSVR